MSWLVSLDSLIRKHMESKKWLDMSWWDGRALWLLVASSSVPSSCTPHTCTYLSAPSLMRCTGDFSHHLTCTMLAVVFVTQSCPALCDPTDCTLPGSSVYGIPQARILEWIAIPFSRGSFWPRDQTRIACTEGRFFTAWATGKTYNVNCPSRPTAWEISLWDLGIPCSPPFMPLIPILQIFTGALVLCANVVTKSH